MHRSTIKNSYPLDKHIAKIYVKEAVNGSNRKALKRLHVKKQRQWNALQVRMGLEDILEEYDYWIGQLRQEDNYWDFDDKWYEEMMMIGMDRNLTREFNEMMDMDFGRDDYHLDESDWC